MKTVKEILVTVKNTPGALSAVNDLLAAGGVGIIAFSAQIDGDTARVSLVSTDPEQTKGILGGAGYAPEITNILAAEIPGHPGGLGTVFRCLKEAGVNIERVYASVGQNPAGRRHVLFLGVDRTEEAHKSLSGEWIRLFGEELYTI